MSDSVNHPDCVAARGLKCVHGLAADRGLARRDAGLLRSGVGFERSADPAANRIERRLVPKHGNQSRQTTGYDEGTDDPDEADDPGDGYAQRWPLEPPVTGRSHEVDDEQEAKNERGLYQERGSSKSSHKHD